MLNALGGIVVTLMNENRLPGRCTVRWDGLDALGNPVGSGVYWVKAESGPRSSRAKMLLLR